MKRFTRSAVFGVFLAFCLAGCKTVPTVAVPAAPASATGLVADSLAQLNAGHEATLGRIKASADVIVTYNAQAPDSPQKNVIAAEAGVIIQNTGTKTVVPEAERVAAAERAKAVAEGNAALAKELYHQTADANAKLIAENAQNKAKVDAEIAALQKKMDDNQAANQKIIDDLKETNRKQAEAGMQKQFWAITLASLAFIGLGIGFVALSPNPLGSVMKGAPFVVCGILGLGLAQLITNRYFIPGCIITGVCIIAAWIIYVWHANNDKLSVKILADKAQQTAEALAAQSGTLKKIVEAGDKVYDDAVSTADSTGVNVMERMFSLLTSKMDKQEKDIVHASRISAPIPASLVQTTTSA